MDLKELIRQLIREVIQEVLQEMGTADSTPGSSRVENPANAVMHLEQGAVTEKMILKLNRDNVTTLRVAANVVVTPLAKEKARAMNITIERGI